MAQSRGTNWRTVCDFIKTELLIIKNLKWWRRWESNPRPKAFGGRIYMLFQFPDPIRERDCPLFDRVRFRSVPFSVPCGSPTCGFPIRNHAPKSSTV